MGIYTEKFQAHQGKVSDKWESYLGFYDSVISSLKIPIDSVLEIGVQNGGSLEIWAEIAPNAKAIIGVDVNPLCADLEFVDPRISVQITDGTMKTWAADVLELQHPLSLIVDDASHISRDVIANFVTLWPSLSPGGKYVIEDLATSYWSTYSGGLAMRNSSMEFLKRLLDVLNFEHWENTGLAQRHLRIFGVSLSATFMSSLSEIQSIEFRNSMCVISKASTDTETGIGLRLITGSQALVDSQPVGYDKMTIAAISMKPVKSKAGSSLIHYTQNWLCRIGR